MLVLSSDHMWLRYESAGIIIWRYSATDSLDRILVKKTSSRSKQELRI